MPNLSRMESARLGRLTYLGRACRHGHGNAEGLSERYTLNSACTACVKDNAAKRRDAIRAMIQSVQQVT